MTGRTWVVAACFAVAFAVAPLLVVLAAPGVDHGEFVCRAAVDSRLAETLEGKLEFLLVHVVEGRAPAERFVVTIDHGYTTGVAVVPESPSVDVPQTAPGDEFWLQGSLMDKDTYFGEQYLFFGYPQLYVSQVKSGVLWPSQVDRLKTLYFSPVATVATFYLVVAYPFMEEFSLGEWVLVIARLVVVCGAIAAAVVYRKRTRRWMPGLAWVVGVYLLLAVGLAIPIL